MRIKLSLFLMALVVIFATATTNQQRQTFGEVFLTSLRFVRSGGIEMEGNKIDLDADRDTSIQVDTDDQIDFEIAGADVVNLTTAKMANTGIYEGAALDFVLQSNALSGTQTITPTSSYLQVAPTDLVLTLTLGTPTDITFLVVHNLNTTSTVIIDTGATAGGGNITLGQNDNAGFFWTGTLWMELFSPDNS